MKFADKQLRAAGCGASGRMFGEHMPGRAKWLVGPSQGYLLLLLKDLQSPRVLSTPKPHRGGTE